MNAALCSPMLKRNIPEQLRQNKAKSPAEWD